MQDLEIEVFYAREHITRPHIYNAPRTNIEEAKGFSSVLEGAKLRWLHGWNSVVYT